VNFLGVSGDDHGDDVANDGELDNAPENDLQVGESVEPKNAEEDDGKKATNATNATKAAPAKKKTSGSHEHEMTAAAKASNAAKRQKAQEKHKESRTKQKSKRAKAEAKEHKQKKAMPAPPPRRLSQGQKRGKVIRLGNMEFVSEKVDSNTLHAKLTLSGRDIRGKTLKVFGNTKIDGALHLRGKGSLLRSKVTNKKLRATLFVNKKNVKSCGIAVSNEGGFFDHNDGFITYEPLDGKNGFKVNSELRARKKIHAEGGLHIGGQGTHMRSSVTKRVVKTIMHTNINEVKGGGFAVSKAGGFFDFKDGAITYEPLEGSDGLTVNSGFKVMKDAHFKGNVKITGKLQLDGEINIGVLKAKDLHFDAEFRKFHTKHNKLEDRVKELESTNAALMERLERMEVVMQATQQQ